jgi:streptogramin lyase
VTRHTAVSVVLAALLSTPFVTPAPASAQAPTFITAWGSAGTGPGQFRHPYGVAVDGSGNVFVADGDNNRIQKFDGNGAYLSQWGTYGAGNGQFAGTFGVAVDGAGTVYATDYFNLRVQKFDGNGSFLGAWGVTYSYPTGIAIAPPGDVLVSIQLLPGVQRYTTGGALTAQWYAYAYSHSQTGSVYAVAADASGNVYVADFTNNRIEKYDANGNYLTQWGTPGSGNGQLSYPSGLAVDSRGLIYVADSGNRRIQVFAPDGTYLAQWGSFGSGNGQFSGLSGIAFDASDDIYVCDVNNQRIQKFGPLPVHVITASADVGGSISPSGAAYVLDGGTATFTITPEACRSIADVLLDGVSIGPVASYTVPGVVSDHTIHASFTPCVTGNIAGHVTAECPSQGSPLLGVSVDAFEVGTGDLLGTAVTDAGGYFAISDIPAVAYTVSLSVPLGYDAPSASVPVTLAGGETATVDFDLSCVTASGDPNSSGFWKHQFGVATGGNGNAQVDAPALCAYLDVIQAHFNENALNQVVVYDVPAGATCADKLQTAKSLLNLGGSATRIDHAREQLLALLLNVAANDLALTDVISKDGATASQAITYCDQLIDDPAGDWTLAASIAEKINSGQRVNAGVIPLSTAQIAYRRSLALRSFRVTPNPGSGPRTFQFAMGQAGPARLDVFDVSGRLVAELARGRMEAGPHTVSWRGAAGRASGMGSGVYFARLETSEGSRTLKVVQLVP